MDCDALGERLEAFLDDELTPSDADAVGAHLAGCAECRKRHDALAGLRRLVRFHMASSAPSHLRASILTEAVARGLSPLHLPDPARPPSSGGAQGGWSSLTRRLRASRLVPALATVAVLVAVVVWQALDRRRPPGAFTRPATVVAVRLGEVSDAPHEPTSSAWTLGGAE